MEASGSSHPLKKNIKASAKLWIIPKNYLDVFWGTSIFTHSFFFTDDLRPYWGASLSNWPGVLAMLENEFMAARGFVSVTLSRLSSEDALTLSRRRVPNIPLGGLRTGGFVILVLIEMFLLGSSPLPCIGDGPKIHGSPCHPIMVR